MKMCFRVGGQVVPGRNNYNQFQVTIFSQQDTFGIVLTSFAVSTLVQNESSHILLHTRIAAMVYVLEGVICHLICRRQKLSSRTITLSHPTSYTPLVCAVIGVNGLINNEEP